MKIYVALINLILFSVFVPQTHAADVFFETSRAIPMVYINIVSDAGAVHDPATKLGLATAAGNMLQRGTKTKTKLEFLKALESLGAATDVDVRAEGTVFRVAFLSENSSAVLALVEETLVAPRFEAAELDKLKREMIGAVLSEKGNDARLAQRHFMRFLYGAHPYGNPIMGTEKGINAINISDVSTFYAEHFGKNTLHIFGSGDADASTVEQWWNGVEEKLAQINPKAKPVTPLPTPNIPTGRRMMLVNKPKATQSQVLFGHAAPRPDADGFYALRLGNHAFGGGSFGARLMQEIRVKRGWTYGASNRISFGKKSRHYNVYFFPKTADTVPALELGLKMLEDVSSNGITPTEFRFAQDSLVNRAPFDYDTPRKRLENQTNEYLFGFESGFFRNIASRTGSISEGEVAPALKRYFVPANLTILVLGDAAILKPALEKVSDVKSILQMNYQDE